MTGRELARLRRAAYELISKGHVVASPVWRTATIDSGSRSGLTLTCKDPDHPTDDLVGVYDCCPILIQMWSEQLAAYMAALLNADTDQER